MTARDSFLNVPDQVIAAPGPGQYDLRINEKVTGGSTLGDRGQRFIKKREAVPGPGSYNVSEQTTWQRNKLLSKKDVSIH